MKFKLLLSLIISFVICSQSVLSVDKKAKELYDKGKKEYDNKNYDSAIDLFKQSLKKEENYTSALYNLGNSYFYTNQFKEAIETFNLLESADPDYWGWYYYFRGQAYGNLGMTDKAVKDFESFHEKYPNTPQKKKLHHQADFKKDYYLGQEELKKQNITMKDLENLGSNINSDLSDYSPQIDPTGKKLYFTSKRKSKFSSKQNDNGEWGEDVYIVRLNGDSYGTPELLPEPINSNNNEGAASFAGDGQTMIYVRCGAKEGLGGCDLYISQLDGDKWSSPVNMGNVVNSEEWDSQPSISADGTKIIFTSSRVGGYGGADLYMIQKNKFGDWGTPQNLGSTINTPSSDKSPYIAADGKTLYFSSNGHPGFGGADLFQSVFENGTWSSPINLGRPLNSEGDDNYFTISASGENAYFASTRDGGIGKYDIYQLEISEDLRPQSIVIVSGIVTSEKNNNPLSAWVLIEDLNTGDLIATNKSNSKTGEYLVVLPAGRNYAVTANSKGYFFYSQNFEVTKETQYQELKKDISLKPIEKGTKVVLNNVFFETGKATLSPESRLDLDKVIDLMQNNPTMTIEVGGHTDNVGDADYNMKLSHERAKSVRQYLVARSITSTKIDAKGYGETTPIADNDTDEGRAANRRTEFIIIEF